jgi:hypothetical protein
MHPLEDGVIGVDSIRHLQYNNFIRFQVHTVAIMKLTNKSVALQALTNLDRLSSRRWPSFPTAPDGTGLTCGQNIESHSCIFQLSKPDRYFFIQVTTQFIRSRG